jgi:hypothetical protein
MIADPLRTRLTGYEEQLQQQLLRRSQLQTALTQCDDLVKRLEGACGVLRELLDPARDPVPPPRGVSADGGEEPG